MSNKHNIFNVRNIRLVLQTPAYTVYSEFYGSWCLTDDDLVVALTQEDGRPTHLITRQWRLRSATL